MNKQRKEEHMDSALLTLQREFSRLGILRGIHSSTRMKEYIAEAYRQGIEFTKEVTVYYSRPTYRRIQEAITKPPKLEIDKKIAEITSAMSEISKEREVLDSRRLYQVQQSINEVRNEVDEIKGGVENIRDGVEGKVSFFSSEM